MPESEPPIKTLEHSHLGRLVLSTWGSSWVKPREFPFLAAYAWADSASDAGYVKGEVEVSEEMRDWPRTAAACLRTNTPFDILAQLHSLGVFGLDFDVGSASEEPSVFQCAAFDRFAAHEQEICAAVMAGVWRYYQEYTCEESYLFDHEGGDLPYITSMDELPRLVEFQDLSIPRCQSQGESPLCFDFSVIWEIEHGFQVLWHGGQIITMDAPDGIRLCFQDPDYYFARHQPKWATPAELDAARAFHAGFWPEDPFEG